MQTFLPVPSFVESMEYLDVSRLGKQRVEAAQIYEILTGKAVLPCNVAKGHEYSRTGNGWERHPAVRMWSGHEDWLALYIACSIGEWCSRGYTNNIIPPYYSGDNLGAPPAWLGYPDFHASHRSNLLRKKPDHYRAFWPNQFDGLPYYWPTKEGY